MVEGHVFLKELIFTKFEWTTTVPVDNSNILRPMLFKLFPNLKEVEVWNPDYALNLKSLLSVLGEYAVSDSFSVLKLNDYADEWIEAAFDSIGDIKEQYEAKGWNIEYKVVEGWRWKEDWISINKLK